MNTSSKPSEAYKYHRSPCHHLTKYLILHYYLTHVYRSTHRQNPQKHTSTTDHNVTNSPYILFSTPTYYKSTGQHVVKTSEAYHYYRSPCHHLAIYLIFYSYLLQVYRSTRRQNPQKHTSTTGHHVITSPYISFSTTTYYSSTGQHVGKTLRSIPVQDYRSTRRQNPQKHTSTTGHHVITSNIYVIIYYYLLQVCRSTRRQNPQNHTSNTGHHVPTANYLLYSANVTRPTNYMSTRRQNPPILKITTGHHVTT